MDTEQTLPVDALMRAYDLGPWESVELLPGGKSQHYRIVTGRGEYVVRRSYRSKTMGGIYFEHELMAHLRRNGFPSPVVIPSTSGDTCVAVDGRLHCVSLFVRGSPYRAGRVEQLQEVARALATYHRLLASFRPSYPGPRTPYLNEDLYARLAALRPPAAPTTLLADSDGGPYIQQLLASLPGALEEGQSELSRLDPLYAVLPKVVIHGGCRRGSAIFGGDRLITMLDFDSARLEARALDLAIAIHDFAKVYGDPASPEYKVPLNLGVVSLFLSAYQEVNPLEPAEIEALPALLVAKRLKRALGRYHRLCKGAELSEGDLRKMTLEIARVYWLEAHRRELQAAMLGRS